MPIPKPKKNETYEKFIKRCMAFTAGTEGRPNDQAFAICRTQWDESKKDKTESEKKE
jgi:hypothetical protein